VVDGPSHPVTGSPQPWIRESIDQFGTTLPRAGGLEVAIWSFEKALSGDPELLIPLNNIGLTPVPQ